MAKLTSKDPKYSYNDIMITPAKLSNINHRSECNPYDNDGFLPLFTAPMDSVVNINNYEKFKENHIIPIIPRTEKIGDRVALACQGEWVAFSLDEFNMFFINEGSPLVVKEPNVKYHVLIDIANGHLKRLYDLVKLAKEIHKDELIIMVGNIANPETYKVCVECGVSFVRCAIGTGCFHPNSLIKTSNGDVMIKDVKKGDYVLTHKNRYRRVVSTKSIHNDEKLLCINGTLKCTKKHKLYVINKNDAEKVNDSNIEQYAYWLEAYKLDKKNHVLVSLDTDAKSKS